MKWDLVGQIGHGISTALIITEKQSDQTMMKCSKKMVHDSQIVRAKENLKLRHGGPSQRQSSGTNQRIKALCQGHH